MTFTAEARARAVATIKENARLRALKKAKPPEVVVKESNIEEWYKSAPLSEVMAAFQLYQNRYEGLRAIITSRQSQTRVFTCWTTLNKETAQKISKEAVAECRQTIPDGRWVFKDDAFRDEHGIMQSQYICSQKCYMAYSQARPRSGLSRNS